MVENVVLVGIVMAISELVKRAELVSTKYIPVLNLLVGIGFSFLWGGSNWRENVFNGLVVGLSAAGVFDTAKGVYLGAVSGTQK